MGRRQFSREFKLEAVRLVEERGVSVVQASRGRFRRHAEAVNTQRRPRPPLRGENGEHVPKGNECRDQDGRRQRGKGAVVDGDAGAGGQAGVEQDGVNVRQLLVHRLREGLAGRVGAGPAGVGVDAEFVGTGAPQIEQRKLTARADGRQADLLYPSGEHRLL